MRLLLSLALALGLAAPAAAQVAIPSTAGREVVQFGRGTGLTVILPGGSAEVPLLDLVKNAPQIANDCAVTLRGGPRLGCYQDGKFVAQPDGLAVGAVPTYQAARQPDAAVSLGGVSGFTGLADPAASARFRASGRGTGYVHFSATDTAFQPSLPSIASTFAPTGPGVIEVSYSNAGSGGGFTPDFWGRSDYVARITSKGFAPTAAVVNLDYGTYAVPWSDLAGWKAYVDGARARTSVRVLAPVIAPNQSGGPGASGDAATVAVVKPWSDPFWASVKQAMLYGGGVSIDAPPRFFFSGLPTKVQQDAYQAFVRDVIAWGHANNLWVAVLVSPYFDKAAFPRNARRYYDALRSADRLPSHWVVLNYDECGAPYPRACTPSDPTYQATIGTEGTPSSQAAVALWYARNAKVRAYAGTYAGVLARPVGQVAPVRINGRDGADQRIQAADVEGVDTMAGQPAEAPVMGAATMDSAVVAGKLDAGDASGSSASPGGDGAVPTTFADLLKDTLPARAYGAKCDGTSDDSAVFAKVQALASGGRIVWPAGTCVLDAVTLASGVHHQGAGRGRTVWLRKPGSAANSFIAGTNVTGVTLADLVTDGNRANQTVGANNVQCVACSAMTLDGVVTRQAKAAGGYGDGFAWLSGADGAQGTRTRLLNSAFVDNDGFGIDVQGGQNVEIGQFDASRNGQSGISFAKADFPPLAGIHDNLRISNGRAIGNAINGVYVGGFYEGGTPARPWWGVGVPQARNGVISGVLASGNGWYGIGYQGASGTLTGNVATLNGTAKNGHGAGYLLNAYRTVMTGNISRDNANFGADLGGCVSCISSGNIFADQGLSAAQGNTVALLIGGGLNNTSQGDHFDGNRGLAIKAIGIEGAGSESLFTTLARGLTISAPTIVLPNTASGGILVTEGADRVTLTGAQVTGDTCALAWTLEGGNGANSRFDLSQSSNVCWPDGPVPSVTAASTMEIPDVGAAFYVGGTATVTTIRTASEARWQGYLRTVVPGPLVPGQYDPDNPPAVTFSGGGCTVTPQGAAALDNRGQFVGVRITNNGLGCTSSPSLAFSSGSGVGYPQVGLNNSEGRVISLHFLGSATLAPGGNLSLAGPLSASAGCQITLRGAFGGWYEHSRRC